MIIIDWSTIQIIRKVQKIKLICFIHKNTIVKKFINYNSTINTAVENIARVKDDEK